MSVQTVFHASVSYLQITSFVSVVTWVILNSVSDFWEVKPAIDRDIFSRIGTCDFKKKKKPLKMVGVAFSFKGKKFLN